MGDDASFYEQALEEADGGRAIPALWARAFADADGDHDRAKARYINLRVAELTRPPVGPSREPSAPGPGQEDAVPVRKGGPENAAPRITPRDDSAASEGVPRMRWLASLPNLLFFVLFARVAVRARSESEGGSFLFFIGTVIG